MRMAKNRGHRWPRHALRLPQDGFESPGGSFEKKVSRFVSFGQRDILM
jgi:hypothetical protein